MSYPDLLIRKHELSPLMAKHSNPWVWKTILTISELSNMEDVKVNLLTPKKSIIQIAPPFIEVSVNLCSLFSMWKVKVFYKCRCLKLKLKFKIETKDSKETGREFWRREAQLATSTSIVPTVSLWCVINPAHKPNKDNTIPWTKNSCHSVLAIGIMHPVCVTWILCEGWSTARCWLFVNILDHAIVV